ncbi:MAG TPA: hypothetical protein PLF44_00235 [Candidatus Mcinerneyibacteriales bacterium]|nr:hypothetical protein [Candidatus Mcinerneyibacteriales bacterium]HPE20472.1 hypothetical protein [Candidatus Mcinerneyibacteriales bacterium]HPJ69283.1 hypothetical protein [Candidatus Mcinerneyibacteriales bacterium]HPQ89642.1 hypothetical protein [Candidatus Mcinerneyibacteriales bacterium]
MRKGMRILFFLVLTGTILGCASTSQNLMQIKESWPMTAMTKDGMMDYFKNNVETLDPIEGVWVMSESISWVNILTGLRGKNEYPRIYVFAVMRDQNQDNIFNGYILESAVEQWNKPGLLKVFFRKMAVENIYEMHWYMGDFTEEIKNINLHPSKGVFSEGRKWAEHPFNYESESLYLKQYPTVKVENPLPKELHGEKAPTLDKP